MSEFSIPDRDEEQLPYRIPEDVREAELRDGLSVLALFNDDPFLRMQAFNVSIVDQFIMGLEYSLLEKLNIDERTPGAEATFVSAQSQMWIFAVYELLRTWRQRAQDLIKWSENGGLQSKQEALRKDQGFPHIGREFRADQIEKIIAEPTQIIQLQGDLKLTHIPFARLEAIRVSLAKHEVKGRKRSVPLRPGYGRINQWCGSLDYELENGNYSLGYISRRDLADEIRALREATLPTDEELADFDAYMRGPSPSDISWES